MQEYDFAWLIHPPGPPFEKQPIPTIGWRNDPLQKELAAELEAASGDSERLERALKKQAGLRRSMSFEEYVNTALAATVEGQDYSYGQFVREIAQQLGGSHEDTAVAEPIVAMQQSVLGHLEGHLAPLIEFCDLVIRVGTQFLKHVTEQHGYQPRYFIGPNGPAAPAPIDSRRAREISVDRPERVSAGTNLEAEGTISVWLKHPHGDWVTNSNGYDFGTVSTGGVSLHAFKDPDCTLRLGFEQQAGLSAELGHRLKDKGRPAVHLAVTWKGGEVKFYVDGELAGAVPLGGP